MKKKISIFCLFVLLVTVANGQTKDHIIEQSLFIDTIKTSILTMNYDIAFPIRNTKEFTDERGSYRGVSFNYKHLISNRIGVGGEVSFQNFYSKKGYTTYRQNETSISGELFAWYKAVPILVYSYYYPIGIKHKLIPYLGIGIGTQYNRDEISIGGMSFFERQWQFATSPEIGAIYDFYKYLCFNFTTSYIQTAKARVFDGQSYFKMQFGLSLILR